MAIAYPGDPLRYGFGPEHRWVPPWQMNLEAAVREAAAEHPIQVPDTDAKPSNPEVPDAGIVGDLLTGGALLTGGLTLNKLLGNPVGGLVDLIKGGGGGGAVAIPPNHPDMGADSPLLDDSPTFGPGEGPLKLPPGYSSDYPYQPAENILDDDIWAKLNEPYNYDPWGLADSGYSSVYPAQYTGGDAGIASFLTPHNYDPFGIAKTGYGSTFDFGSEGAGNLDFNMGDLIQGSGGDEEIAGGILDDLLGGGGGAPDSKLFGFDVANPITDTLGGLGAIYQAATDPNPSTILQGVGGALAVAQLLPGFGTAFGLYNGIIQGMKWLTGAGDKVPWGGAQITLSNGSLGPLEANAGYGGQDIAAKLADKAAKVQAELQIMATAQGLDLKQLLGPYGTGAIQFQPTGTREQPDADRPAVRILTTDYSQSSPRDLIVGVANGQGEGIEDPKIIAAQLLQTLIRQPAQVDISPDYQSGRYAEGGFVMPEKHKATERALRALMEALGISRREATELLRGSIKDTDLEDFVERLPKGIPSIDKEGERPPLPLPMTMQGMDEYGNPVFDLPFKGIRRGDPDMRDRYAPREFYGFADGGFIGGSPEEQQEDSAVVQEAMALAERLGIDFIAALNLLQGTKGTEPPWR